MRTIEKKINNWLHLYFIYITCNKLVLKIFNITYLFLFTRDFIFPNFQLKIFFPEYIVNLIYLILYIFKN